MMLGKPQKAKQVIQSVNESTDVGEPLLVESVNSQVNNSLNEFSSDWLFKMVVTDGQHQATIRQL